MVKLDDVLSCDSFEFGPAPIEWHKPTPVFLITTEMYQGPDAFQFVRASLTPGQAEKLRGELTVWLNSFPAESTDR